MQAIAAGTELSRIVEDVYDCVGEQWRWPAALDRIRRIAEGEIATIAVVDTGDRTARFMATCGDEAVLSPLVSSYASEVPFCRAAALMDIDVPMTVDQIYDLHGPGLQDDWRASRIVREWVMPNRFDDFFWVALMRQPGRVGTLMVVTSIDRHEITSEEIATVGLIAPHVRRAVTIGDLFEAEQRRTGLFRAIVESLAHPVLVVGADMSILFANAAAEMLLRERGAIHSARGRLGFAYSPAGSAIARAVSLGMRDEFALGPAGIGVPLAQAAAPAIAHVMPLAHRDRAQRVDPRAAAAIFVAVAGGAPLPAMEAIAALYGLTPAEKRVAGQVAAGLTRRDIADAAGVSDGTVKSQLAAIFDKTGTGDQRELQLLMRELAPPVEVF